MPNVSSSELSQYPDSSNQKQNKLTTSKQKYSISWCFDSSCYVCALSARSQRL